MRLSSFALAFTLTLFPLVTVAQDSDAMRLDLGEPAQEIPLPAEEDSMAMPLTEEGAPIPEATAIPETTAPAAVATDITGMERVDTRVAQGTATSGGQDDKDHMIACSIIYQRIADMYQERGESDNATSFVRTAYAYSQTADILYTQELGAEAAYDVITQRMTLISDSLNRESQSLPNGDLGVIENWLGWCDERGEFVQNTIDSFNAQ
jgi:hypothetical protein